MHLLGVGDPLQRERQAPAVGVDLDDPHREHLALADHLARVLDVVRGELRDVDQALDTGVDLDERAEGDHLRDLALDDVGHVVGVDDALPRVGLGLLEAEGDPLPVAVDVEHLDLDLVADRQHLGRVVDVAPGQLGDVDEAVDALEVDERAEIDDVRDDALHDLAGLELVEDLLADLTTLVLEDRAAGQHHVVAVPVELDDLALELAAEELVEVLHAPDVDQGRREEPADAEVEDQAALDDLDDRALDVLAGGGRRLDPLPGLLEARALLGEDQAPVLVLLGHHEGVDQLAELDLLGDGHRLPDGQLGDRDDAFALVADVDEDLVLVDPHDPPRDDVPLLEERDGLVVVRHHDAVDLDVLGPGECERAGLDVDVGGVDISG